MIPTRFNEGRTAWPQYEILYLAENPTVATFEVQALLGTPGSPVPNPTTGAWVILDVSVKLQRIADLSHVSMSEVLLDTSAQELTGRWRS